MRHAGSTYIINCFDIWNTPHRTHNYVQPTRSLAQHSRVRLSLTQHTADGRRPTRERRPTRSADTHQHMPLYATCERSSCTVHTHIPHPADPILCPRILVHTPRSYAFRPHQRPYEADDIWCRRVRHMRRAQPTLQAQRERRPNMRPPPSPTSSAAAPARDGPSSSPNGGRRLSALRG
jgi:hypothetical protein